jgi:hypothetical protein
LIWSGEDSISDTLVRRLIASGADLKRVYFVDVVIEQGKPRPFDPAKDMTRLLAAAAEIPNLGMVVLDPIVIAVKGDSHKNTEVRRGALSHSLLNGKDGSS